MNRLRDGAGEDPVALKGIELVRGTPPAPRMPELKDRVWMFLQRTDDGPQRAAKRPASFRLFRTLRMRTLALGVGILCATGSAGAMILSGWIVPARDQPAPTPGRPPQAKTSTRFKTPQQPLNRQIAEPAFAEPAFAELERGDRTPLRSAASTGAKLLPANAARSQHTGATDGQDGRSSSRTPKPVPTTRTVASTPLTGSSSERERTEVLDAMIALRRNHDPERAAVLLEKYLSAHPRGALHEEALALAIEAADARADRASAQSLARLYQARYPRGRFLSFAQSHAEPNSN
jgi:hypothetical protein